MLAQFNINEYPNRFTLAEYFDFFFLMSLRQIGHMVALFLQFGYVLGYILSF